MGDALYHCDNKGTIRAAGGLPHALCTVSVVVTQRTLGGDAWPELTSVDLTIAMHRTRSRTPAAAATNYSRRCAQRTANALRAVAQSWEELRRR